MKKLTALLLFSFLAAASANATLFWYEGFQYKNGSIITNSIIGPGTNALWTRESGSAVPSDLLVLNSNLQVAATGGSLITRQDDCDRLFVETNGNSYTNLQTYLVYASFTIICTNLPNGAGSYFASFYNTNKGYVGRLQAFTNGTVLPNTWRLGVTDNVSATNKADGGFPVDLALNTPYQVVEEMDPINLAAATIWINPINTTQTGFNSVDPSYTASDSQGFEVTNEVNSYAFRQASSFGNAFFVITNLATATTFAEAATNVWATNAVPPVIVYQPVGLTNYVGNPVSLSAVANGQGLASLTYQWLQGGVPYPSGNGANILNIPSAQTTDDGSYTIVATTPYGLSVTSSAVTVFISNAAVPPTFTSQPVSQSVYNGQTVIFTTSVISPDINTVTYQWYSNNVAVAGATTSTFTLNNASTNISGSLFSVAVTNDVTPNGIVSSNAVLTVLSPQQVTIAYLRTLVDPVAYAPTNVPPSIPYSVTGTITTFTNITSGTTASYYLQDGTAGVNIFVTGSSTFRPAQGDVVTFIGVLSSFTGLELDCDVTAQSAFPYTSFTDTGTTNALPAPRIISFTYTNLPTATPTNGLGLAYVNTNLAESLVEITNVFFGTNAGTVISASANENVTVTNSLGQKLILTFFDLDLDTAGKILPTNAISVKGVLYGQNPAFSIGVTRFADIVTNLPVTVLIPTNSIYITGFSLVSGNVAINATNGQTGGTYYMLSSTNVLLPLSQWTPVATNVAASTNFTFTGTNVITPSAGRQFYILSSTN